MLDSATYTFACVCQAIVFVALTGMGLALVQPSAQSVIADIFAEHKRGRAFGAIFTVSALGVHPDSMSPACAPAPLASCLVSQGHVQPSSSSHDLEVA